MPSILVHVRSCVPSIFMHEIHLTGTGRRREEDVTATGQRREESADRSTYRGIVMVLFVVVYVVVFMAVVVGCKCVVREGGTGGFCRFDIIGVYVIIGGIKCGSIDISSSVTGGDYSADEDIGGVGDIVGATGIGMYLR
ncbi:hypothetical protein NDU88_006171 [Pleurodeles waltl]|uniref:Uncharacterized protein n=1 Tax=Pleurodeles waltl TaxID=8319 RepID=A0AAV7TCR3_PLEWA|nr:hypothetical protein NDU88_006171 [Pleurodeles waltl]